MTNKILVVALAIAAFAIPAEAAKMTRAFDKSVGGKNYHFMCIMKNPALEYCGNYKVLK